MFAVLFAVALLVAVALAVALVHVRRDIRRLSERIDSDDPQSLASLDVDSFGALDSIAAIIHRTRSDLSRRLAGAERQKAMLRHIVGGRGGCVGAVGGGCGGVVATRRFIELFGLEPGFVGKPIGEVVRNASVFAGFDRALAREDSTEQFMIRAGAGERRIEM